MKCPYPDCPGEVDLGEQFCDECGRSVDNAAVRAALAGMEARTAAPSVTTPQRAPYRPPAGAQVPVTPAAGAPEEPPVALLGALVVGLLLLLLLSIAGATVLNGGPAAEPTAPTDQRSLRESFEFRLGDLGPDGEWQAKYELTTLGGEPAGTISVRRGAAYEAQGAGEKMVSLIVAENDADVVELTAGPDAIYEGISPGWEALKEGASVSRTLPSGLALQVTPRSLVTDAHPVLPTGRPGNQAIFTSLVLQITVTGTVGRQ